MIAHEWPMTGKADIVVFPTRMRRAVESMKWVGISRDQQHKRGSGLARYTMTWSHAAKGRKGGSAQVSPGVQTGEG